MVRINRRPRHRLDPDSRRAAILEAAAATFAAHPYAEVTISFIAAKAYSSDALVYRYFTNKRDLCAEVVRMAITDLLARQAEVLDTLPNRVPVHDRIRATIMVYLDHIAAHPNAWVMPIRRPGGEPTVVAELRTQTRRDYMERLQDLLVPSTQARRDYALWGYFDFIDATALRWVGKGCPKEDRRALIDATLDALKGAPGDWAA